MRGKAFLTVCGLVGLVTGPAALGNAAIGRREVLKQPPASQALEMKLVRDFQDGESPHFQLLLHNAQSDGIVVEIGTTQGNGRAQYLNRFRYVLRLPSGALAELTVREPESLFGQKPMPLTVPLAPGATLSLPIVFREMLWTRPGADWSVHLPPGQYQFWVEFREMDDGHFAPGVLVPPQVPYWVGSLRTTPITFRVGRP